MLKDIIYVALLVTIYIPGQSQGFPFINKPRVSLLKEGPAELRKEQKGNFKLTIKNTHTTVVQDVVVYDRIPPGMAYKSYDRGLVLEWNLGNLQPNEIREIGYVLTATRASTNKNEFTSVAKVAVEGKVVDKTEMITYVIEPELYLKSLGPRLVFAYRTADYKITITNKGGGPAFDVLIKNTIAGGFDYVSSKPRGLLKPVQGNRNAEVSWRIPEIAAQSKTELTITLRAKKPGTFRNLVKLTSRLDLPPVVPLEVYTESSIIGGLPTMFLSTFDTKDPCRIGGQTAYTIEARNIGTFSHTNIVIENKIPDEMKFVSASGPVDYSYNEEKKFVVFEPVKLIAPGEKCVYTIVCEAVKEGNAKNVAKMRYDQLREFSGKPIIDEEGTTIHR